MTLITVTVDDAHLGSIATVARELDQAGLLREILGARASGLANRCLHGRRSGRGGDGSGISGAHESGFHAADQASIV